MGFGEMLRRLRAQHNISQRDLAERVGIDFTYISKIENGSEQAPSEEVLIKMAEVFSVNKYDLIISAGKTPSDFSWVIRVDEEAQKYLRDKVEHWNKIKEEKK